MDSLPVYLLFDGTSVAQSPSPSKRLVCISPGTKKLARLASFLEAVRNLSGAATGDALHAIAGAQQQQVRRAAGEQAIGDHAHDVVQFFFHLDRAGDIQVVDVDDDVAVVGGYTVPIYRVTAELHDFPANVASGHGNDFNR